MARVAVFFLQCDHCHILHCLVVYSASELGVTR